MYINYFLPDHFSHVARTKEVSLEEGGIRGGGLPEEASTQFSIAGFGEFVGNEGSFKITSIYR